MSRCHLGCITQRGGRLSFSGAKNKQTQYFLQQKKKKENWREHQRQRQQQRCKSARQRYVNTLKTPIMAAAGSCLAQSGGCRYTR